MVSSYLKHWCGILQNINGALNFLIQKAFLVWWSQNSIIFHGVVSVKLMLISARQPCLCWYMLWNGNYPHYVLVTKIVEAEEEMFQKLYDLIRQELKCCEKLKESGNLSGSESQWHINPLAPFETIWLGAIRQQPITWASVDASLCCHIKSLGHNELNIYHDTI